MAPRYDPRLKRALLSLDDRRRPIAETCRRAGAVAERLGVTRPSYVHVRRLVLAERERRARVRALLDGAVERARVVRVAVASTGARRLVGARRSSPAVIVLAEADLVALSCEVA